MTLPQVGHRSESHLLGPAHLTSGISATDIGS